MQRFSLVRARWTLTFALALVAFALGSFGFLFVATTHAERNRIDASVRHELAIVAGLQPSDVASHVTALLVADEHRTRFAGVFDAAGRPVAGNLARLPADLALDGTIRETVAVRQNERGRKIETMRAAALRLPDGRAVMIGNDLDAYDQSRRDLSEAIAAGLLPALVVAIGLGAAFGAASQRRVRTIEIAIERIVAGDFTGRLPVAGNAGDIDRIALGVNRMLDAIELLYHEIRGVGDDMAHDLRTPLGRVRAQLERSRNTARTATDFRVAIDRAIVGLDAALAVIIAILRIGQIEHRARRSGFARVDLAALVRDVADLYAPIAEDAEIALSICAGAPQNVEGDRELLFEALANLVDNAVKFTPAGGRVFVRGSSGPEGVALSVIDEGPGIPGAERDAVLKRFIRGDKSRGVSGNGLGLSLVAAIARLHGCDVTIGDASPGCVVSLTFPPSVPAPAPQPAQITSV